MRIALVQLTSSRSVEDNLGLVRARLAEAGRRHADVVVFPEATMRAFGHSLTEVAEPLDGPWADAVRAAADDAGVVAVVGMFTPGEPGTVRNTLLVHGRGVDTHYDKIHLYDAFGFLESDTVTAGKEPVTFTVDGVTFGLATCYDVRFPNLFTATADDGAQVQIVCASWGPGPGKAEQWDLLVRARALDSTTFVVACGQGDPETVGAGPAGSAPTGIGHSAVVSPLGKTVVALGGKPELAVVDIDPSTVDDVRATLPVLANARRF